MDTKKIESLIKLMKKHSLFELELEDDDERVRLVSAPPGSSFGYTAPQPLATVHEIVDHDIPSRTPAAVPLPSLWQSLKGSVFRETDTVRNY